MKKKRMTNEQVVAHMMKFSNYGALSQAFIMEAISRYATQCAAADPKDLDNAMLSGKAWVGVAKEIKHKLDEHFAD